MKFNLVPVVKTQDIVKIWLGKVNGLYLIFGDHES